MRFAQENGGLFYDISFKRDTQAPLFTISPVPDKKEMKDTVFLELTEDMKAKKLSSGMMAKLKIAVTIAREARLYLLDEPLNGIDLLARDQIMKSILEAIDPDVTLVVSSHLVDELERVADAAIFMKDGILANQCMVEELRINQHKSVVDLYREIYGHGGEEVC